MGSFRWLLHVVQLMSSPGALLLLQLLQVVVLLLLMCMMLKLLQMNLLRVSVEGINSYSGL